MAVRLIPGAVGPESLRGLLISDSPAQPAVAVENAPAAVVIEVSPQLLDAEFAAALAPLLLWQFRIVGLTAHTSYRVQATAAGATTAPISFTTLDPAARSVKIVSASCFYDGFRSGTDYASMLRGPFCKSAALKLLIGDNLYIDIHPGQSSITDGPKETADLYRQYFWSGSGYPEALSTLPTLTTWDDHEIWNNAPEEQFWLSRTRGAMRGPYLRAARAGVNGFQVPLNPDPPIPGTSSYVVNDLPLFSLFVLDARMQRSLKDPFGSFARDVAIDALVEWTLSLEDQGRPGVLVIGQPLLCDTGSSSDYTPADFPMQFLRIWRAIHDAPWEILILTGDVHHSRASSWLFRDSRRLFEIITSPAAHIPTVLSEIFGTYGKQGQGDVEMPTSVKAGGLDLALADYYFGTDIQNTIATLEFNAGGAGAVHVGCTFLDLRTTTVAPAVRANRGFFRSGIAPQFPHCVSEHLFTLRRR